MLPLLILWLGPPATRTLDVGVGDRDMASRLGLSRGFTTKFGAERRARFPEGSRGAAEVARRIARFGNDAEADALSELTTVIGLFFALGTKS
jgi:hypothetical protein